MAMPRPAAPWLEWGFARYTRFYLARNLHTLRLSRAVPPPCPEGFMVIYANHPAWWDPLTLTVLATGQYPEREHFAVIEAEALSRYRIFERLGFFGVQASGAGARRFLTIAQALARRPRAILWLTPQGRFADPRERPLRLAPGLGHLAARLERGVLVPLALEYPFWEERYPEALLRFGEAVDIATLPSRPARDWSQLLAQRLEAAQDALAQEALARDPKAFLPLLRGNAGVGGVYGLAQRLKARLRGQSYRPEHGNLD